LFIIAAAVLGINTLIDQMTKDPLRTTYALGIIGLGVPAYFIWRVHSKVAIEPIKAPETS
jgi:hypothetical protein